MNHIFLFPTELEAASFRLLCPDAEVVISGVGMAATAATLLRFLHEGRTIVLAGIAGAYGGRVALGEVVEVVSERVAELPERFQREYRTTAQTTLRGVVSNTVCGCGVDSRDADIENMEGAALFAMAEAAGFKAVEIRAISNIVGEPFEMWDIPLATTNLAQRLKSLFID